MSDNLSGVEKKLYILCAGNNSWLKEDVSARGAIEQWWNPNRPSLMFVLEIPKREGRIEELIANPSNFSTYRHTHGREWPDGSPQIQRAEASLFNIRPYLDNPVEYTLKDVIKD